MPTFSKGLCGGAATVSLLLLSAFGGAATANTAGGTPTSSTITSTTTGPTAASDPVGNLDSVLDLGYKSQKDCLNGDSLNGATGLPNTAFKAMPKSGTAT